MSLRVAFLSTVLIAGLTGAGVFAGDVITDFDRQFDMSGYKAFAWLKLEKTPILRALKTSSSLAVSDEQSVVVWSSQNAAGEWLIRINSWQYSARTSGWVKDLNACVAGHVVAAFAVD